MVRRPHIGYTFLGDDDFRCDCDLDQEDYLLIGGRLGYYLTSNFALEMTGNTSPSEPEYWELAHRRAVELHSEKPGLEHLPGVRRRRLPGGGVQGRRGSDRLPRLGSEYRFNKLPRPAPGAEGGLQLRDGHRPDDGFGEFTQDSRDRHSAEHRSPLPLRRRAGAGRRRFLRRRPSRRLRLRRPRPRFPGADAAAGAARRRASAASPAPTTDTIEFDRGSSRVTNIAKARLDSVALRLRENPRATVVITGYPDEAGSRSEALARRRAENAKAYLIDRHAIDASRITTETNLTDETNFGKAVIVVTFNP